MKPFFNLLIWGGVCILLAISINVLYNFFYPIKYREVIEKYSEKYNVEASLIASVVNVESGYKNNKTSSKGAIGLMQILPSTAEWIANKLGEEYEEDKLFESDCNIRYGSYYLSYLINYFGDENLAICAYNAGMGKVKQWLNNGDFFVDGKICEIPYWETKNYFRKIIKNKRYYKNKY